MMLSQSVRPRMTTAPRTKVLMRRPSFEMSGRSPTPMSGHGGTRPAGSTALSPSR